MYRTFGKAAALLAAVLGLLAMTTANASATSAGSPSVVFAPAVAHEQITGSGSSWSANAVNQWIADVTQTGLQVVFTSTGSAQGRKDFTNKTTDFAVSDIGYQGTDPVTNDADSQCTNPSDFKNGIGVGPSCRSFAYLPIVAGGTAFPYQLKVAGKLVRNLRLSGLTLAKIFTNKITNWNDPAITADMNGKAFPSIPIVVVVHSEGSGSTAQFTRYLDKQFPSLWRPFLKQSGSTEYFPKQGQQIAQNGSDGVINFLTSKAANGAIGYDEYSYALAKNYPVAKIKNVAGYYTEPTQYNVAVALTQAKICGIDTKPSAGNIYCQPGTKPADVTTSPQYLLQDLDGVYVHSDPRTYPLSSYSYMLIPTSSSDVRMKTAKRQTLADFLYYSICQGQKEMGPIGYSPLPVNLVQASFSQTAKLKAADSGVDLTARNISTCNNPTFVKGNPKANHLAQIAPQPPACDKVGAGPCGATVPNNNNPGSNPSGNPSGNGSNPSGNGSNPSGNGSNPSGNGSNPGGGTPSPGATNPDTGLPDGSGGTGSGTDVTGTVTEIAAYRATDLKSALAPVVAIELLALLVLPPAAYFLWIRRRKGSA
jgi:phosphate transport system substrate-binding protein